LIIIEIFYLLFREKTEKICSKLDFVNTAESKVQLEKNQLLPGKMTFAVSLIAQCWRKLVFLEFLN